MSIDIQISDQFNPKMGGQCYWILQQLEESKKQTLYDLIDTYIRDCKTRKTYS